VRGYAICTEPRSGSAFLCRLLASTGVLGRPAEYFNADSLRNWRGVADYPLDPEGQLAAVTRMGATPNGVYGLKLFSFHFDAVKATRWAERLPSLSFIHLERRDLLGQAISHVRALQTRQWTSLGRAEAEPAYDQAAINAALVRLARAQTRWRYYFARNGAPCLHLVYEEIMRFPQETAEAVAHLVGLEETPRIDLARTGEQAIQRDGLNDEWRARFISKSRSLSEFS